MKTLLRRLGARAGLALSAAMTAELLGRQALVRGLKLPVRGKAVWKLAEDDQEYIDVTITELHHEV